MPFAIQLVLSAFRILRQRYDSAISRGLRQAQATQPSILPDVALLKLWASACRSIVEWLRRLRSLSIGK